MKLGMGVLEVRNYARVPTIQPSTINYQHSPSLQDGGTLHKHKNFEELPKTLTGNSQSQLECRTLSRALPTSNPTYNIQLPRDIHEMLSNVAHP